jgi:propionyl-CoA carboxylase alpha chain
MEHEAFRSGDFDTRFVENHFRPESLSRLDEDVAWISAAIAVTLMNGNGSSEGKVTPSHTSADKWKKRRLES